MSLAECGLAMKVGVVFVYKVIGHFDESEDQEILCMAGFFAPVHHWSQFEVAWTALVGEYKGLQEFHTYECVSGKGYWDDWGNPGQRSAVQQRFLDLITVNPYPSPMGFVVGIDLAAYNRTAGPTIRATTTGGYDKAWLLAFTHALGRMVEAQRMANERTGVDQRVGLFFDEKDEFRGRVEEMIKTVKADAGYPLGAVAFDASENQPALQAADLLAYEARRYLTEVVKGSPPKPVRKQWQQLRNARTLSGNPRIWTDY
ncbi:MAG TPA: DUF3800 domain-containing protein [Candidatus Saccharimonadales bacterium]|nr:DUF3800 domain-containing protein [Candidatus Saccharimonadales bacterium]